MTFFVAPNFPTPDSHISTKSYFVTYFISYLSCLVLILCFDEVRSILVVN